MATGNDYGGLMEPREGPLIRATKASPFAAYLGCGGAPNRID